MKSVACALAFFLALQWAGAADRVVLPDAVAPVSYDLAIIPDVTARSFTGSVKIALTVKRPTADIVLNAADLAFGAVSLTNGKTAKRQTPVVRFDKKTETAILHVPERLAPGPYVLSISYRGRINAGAAGLFALDYDAGGKSRTALYTQFENSDARRFLPCWDEPGVKAVFTLSATLPASETALSNMPVAHTDTLADGRKRVRFAASPKMSSYLLFYAQGDFERVSRKVAGVDVGVVVKRGDTRQARYALDAAAKLLPYYNAYFGTPYPLPKLDLVAGPGRSPFYSAMENWGAIFYFEHALLIDPARAGEADRRRIFVTVAHEMAHQWFGDLVTMAWWDDLWLNEGFATWMENKATDHFHPEWKIWQDTLASVDATMKTDAGAGTHPIIQPIADVAQANDAFDDITYVKGAAVIRMLEDHLGTDIFRAGVRAYMRKYAYANTVSDDLWAELDRAAHRPVAAMAHDFTLQSGLPLIRATQTATGLQLRQDRFATDSTGKRLAAWRVPVKVADLKGRILWQGIVTQGHPQNVAVPKGAVALINPGRIGYYRTDYDPDLTMALVSRFSRLSAADQLGLIGDAKALGLAGYHPLSDILTLLGKSADAASPQVQTAIADAFAELDRLCDGLPAGPALRAYASASLAPQLEWIGWTDQAGDDGNTVRLRADLIETLGDLGDAATVDHARRLFAEHAALRGDVRDAVLAVVAANARPDDWDALLSLARAEPAAQEKADLYQLLGRPRDPVLARRAMALALADEAPATIRPAIVSAVAARHPAEAFDFALAHKAAFDADLEPNSRVLYYVGLLSTAADRASAEKLSAFAAAHIAPEDRGMAEKVMKQIARTLWLRENKVPEIERELAARADPDETDK